MQEKLKLIERAIGPDRYKQTVADATREAESSKKVLTDLVDYMKEYPADDHTNLARIGTRIDYLFRLFNDAIDTCEKHPRGQQTLKSSVLAVMFKNINDQSTKYKQFLTRMEIL